MLVHTESQSCAESHIQCMLNAEHVVCNSDGTADIISCCGMEHFPVKTDWSDAAESINGWVIMTHCVILFIACFMYINNNMIKTITMWFYWVKSQLIRQHYLYVSLSLDSNDIQRQCQHYAAALSFFNVPCVPHTHICWQRMLTKLASVNCNMTTKSFSISNPLWG